MTRWKSLNVVVAACASLLASGLPAAAQDWKAEWTKTVAAAKKEGEVVVYSQPNQTARAFVQREWAKAYPEIAVSLTVMPSPKFVARIRLERHSDKYLWDLGFAGANAGYALYKDGTVEPFAPELIDPNINNPDIWGGWDQAYVDIPKKYVFAMSNYIRGPWYNAAHVDGAKVKKLGLEILLDPAYRGRIVWHDPLSYGTGQTMAWLLYHRLGKEALRKVLVDQQVDFVAQQYKVVEAMARGTHWIGLGAPVKGLIARYQKAGVNVDVRSFGNGPDVNIASIGGSALYVFNKRPHPNATRVFINWLLSKDIQTRLSKVLDQGSRREDVPSFADSDETPRKGVRYIAAQREEYVEERDQATEYVRSIRRSLR